MYKVGDTVVVIDNGRVYTTHENWVLANNFKGFKKGADPQAGIKGVVEVVAPHNDYTDTILLGIDCNGTKAIIDAEGVELVKSVYHNPPHKHAELIKAWADGAEIEYYSDMYKAWTGVDYPGWAINSQYRIKPSEPTPKELAEQQLKELEAKVEEIKATIPDLE